MLSALLAFSLIKRFGRERILSLHRLVQVVQQASMTQEQQRQWATRLVLAVQAIFPREPESFDSWQACQRYLEQAQACDRLIGQYQLVLPEAADVLDRAGNYLLERASYSLAEPLLQRALAMREQHFGDAHPEVARSLSHLAGLWWKQGVYAQAEPLYQRALHIHEQHFGDAHPEVAKVLNNLALLYNDQGDYTQAEPHYLRSLHIFEQQFGPDHLDVATPLYNLALLYHN